MHVLTYINGYLPCGQGNLNEIEKSLILTLHVPPLEQILCAQLHLQVHCLTDCSLHFTE